ncbi:unnamed protein product [Ceratitis capitata]|uniref:(Mediterranean fruit fly) hypothetical protein n=1 Tax=Ceratitis capitata TaxID=7213 RepID=A0A811U505_CERCA|nr:unnamed protein product [Ceratitis capitata]
MQPEQVTVWCGLWAGGILGPHFFKDDASRNVAGNYERDLLRGEFGEHFISSSGSVNWPPRSCDLTPLDYFVWDYVKFNVYTGKPASIDALEDNIEALIRELPAEMLERVCQNWTKRMFLLRHSHGQRFHEIIFKH